ncbi:MAG: porin [Gammaproteobacteria bacterium]|nr:MAG: porin [Gammaproteobacteria bacterium]
MNKKFIVTAMGLVLAGGMGLANADVKIYGQITLELDAIDSDAPGFEDDINMNSNTSSFGVKGSEDLGNGLSALFKLEWQADPTQRAKSITDRDQFIGLKMKRFGKVIFGTASTAYKAPGKKIDPFYRTNLQSRQIGLQSNLHSGAGEQGEGRGENMVRYDSPKFNGFGVLATYQFDNDKSGTSNPACGTASDCDDDDPYSFGVTYKGGNFFAAASYISTQQSGDAEAAQFMARYTWNALEFHGIYELDQGLITAQRSNGFTDSNGGRDGSAKDDGADIYSIGATYTIGNNVIGADWGQGSDSDGKDGINNNGGGDDVQEYDVWRIAAWHKFSKRTGVFAGYANTDYDIKGEDEIVTLGMRHKF